MSKFRTMGDLARDLGDFGKAAEHYGRHVAEHPDDAAIWVQLGHAIKEHLGPEHAIDAYRKATLCARDEPDALVHLAHALKAAGRTAEAAEMFRSALVQGPTAEVVRELSALGEQVEVEPLALAVEVTYLAVQDLLGYLRAHPTMSGIQRVQAGIAEHVLTEGLHDVRFIVSAGDGELDRGLYYEIPGEGVRRIISYASGRQVDHDRLRLLIDDAEARKRIVQPRQGDTIILLGAFWGYGNTADRFLAAKRAGVRIGCYIYDLIPISHPEYCDAQLVRDFGMSLCEIIAIADFFLTISQFTATSLAAFIERHGLRQVPIAPVPLAHSLTGKPSDRPSWPKKLAALGERRFALYVSTIEGRKNHLYVLHVWRRLLDLGVKVPDLVFVGRMGWRVQGLKEMLDGNRELARRVHIVHDLTDDEVTALYRRCMFTVFTSFVEGWGLPVGESLVNGAPCIASNTSSIPEVGGDFVDYVDPYDVSGGIAVFRRMIEDDAYRAVRAQRIAREFRPRQWKAVAQDFFGKVAERSDAARPEIRLPAGRLIRLGGLAEHIEIADYAHAPLRLVLAPSFYPAEDFGAWMRGPSGVLEFASRLPVGTAISVYLTLRSPLDRVMKAHVWVGERSDRLGDVLIGQKTVVQASGRVEHDGLVRIGIEGEGVRPPNDNRLLGIGLTAIGFSARSDVEGRLNIIENLLMHPLGAAA